LRKINEIKMSEIKFFQATTEHLEMLVESRVEFLTEFWGEQTDEAKQKLRMELKTFFEREIPLQTYVSWIAICDEKLVGVGGMKIYQMPGSFRIPNGMIGYIINMHTVKSHRRQGIAGEIVKRLVETGKELGVNLFDLHASKEGEPVYVKAGFNKHDEPSYRKIILR
jgi:RimJ/RimL family protein N-acetyltransferase